MVNAGDILGRVCDKSEDNENDGGYIDGQLDPSASNLREMLKTTTLETNYRCRVLPLQ